MARDPFQCFYHCYTFNFDGFYGILFARHLRKNVTCTMIPCGQIVEFYTSVLILTTTVKITECQWKWTSLITGNKKVLLREGKMHTARRVASTRYPVPVGLPPILTSDLTWMGVPPSWWQGVSPSQVRTGGFPSSSPDGGVPHLRSGWGYPHQQHLIPLILTWDGVPPGIGTGWGYPSPNGDGWEYPPVRKDGFSLSIRMRYPLLCQEGWGYPPLIRKNEVSPHLELGPGQGDRHTEACQNIPFPRTPYAGDNERRVC